MLVIPTVGWGCEYSMNANKCIRVHRGWKRADAEGDAIASLLAQCFFSFGSSISLITEVNPPHLIPPKV